MTNLRTYGTAPYTVAVLHGGPGAAGQMAPVARRLADEHGILEPLQTAATIDGQVEELRHVIDKNGEPPVTLIGSSWGGYLATRALLTFPDAYSVGIAISPASDPGGKATVYEPYMGVPGSDRTAHEMASNIPLAGNLGGSLLIIHGTNDVNAPLAETMRLVDALVSAGRPHDLIILPNQDHYVLHARGPSGEYARHAIRRYLIEHLVQ